MSDEPTLQELSGLDSNALALDAVMPLVGATLLGNADDERLVLRRLFDADPVQAQWRFFAAASTLAAMGNELRPCPTETRLGSRMIHHWDDDAVLQTQWWKASAEQQVQAVFDLSRAVVKKAARLIVESER